MRRYSVLFLLFVVMLLNACSGSLPLDLEFLSTSTRPAETAMPEITNTPTVTFTPLPTQTATATITLVPTRRSPFPVTLGTPLPDPGFLKIGSGNLTLLKAVFEHTVTLRQTSVVSPNQEKVMLATSDGLSLFDIDGNLIAAWPEIKMANIACSACLTVNEDASRFAIVERKDGLWQIQIYDIEEKALKLVRTIAGTETFGLEPNPVQVAMSPDGELLVYAFGDNSFVMENLFAETQTFEYSGKIQSLKFSRGGQYIFGRRGQELLIWDIYRLEDGFRNVLLPSDNVAIDFSLGGEYVAIASSSKVYLYRITPLRLEFEIDVPPDNVTNRTWQLAFLNDEILRGYALDWDPLTQIGRATTGVWDVLNNETLELEETQTDSPNSFDSFWGVEFSETEVVGGLDLSEYRDMRFISTDVLMVNSLKAVCSFKLATGETSCQEPGDDFLHASDGSVFREVREFLNTFLINPLGETVFKLDPYPISWINRTADFLLLDVNGDTTDLYLKNRERPVQSVPGAFRSASENANLLVFLTKQKNELIYMTMVEKSTQKALFQKRETRLFDPVVMAIDGSTYFMREDLDNNQASLKVIPPGTDEVSDLLQIDLFAQPLSMAVSSQNILAIGMQDGSVTIVSLDSLTQQTFQALQSPIEKIAISPDGRYLAVAGKNGIKVFAVIP